jgi:hypothetical protein
MNKTPERRQAQSGVQAEQMHLFEPPPFSPNWPKPETLAGRALALLLEGREISHPEFERISGSWRLSEPVRALRHDFGWPVCSNDLPAPTDEHPDRVISFYYLPAQVLEAVGAHHE